MTRRSCFITLEGLDGAGKSTHVEWIAQMLRQAGVDLICTREPGGTPLGDQVREMVLHEPMDLRTEALLFFAARNEHWVARIGPALARGQWVLCDRYTDASYAYQGGGRELGAEAVQALEDWLPAGRVPDCTFLFDIPPATALLRRQQARLAADRFEEQDSGFFERTRQAYLARVAAQPCRFRVLDGRADIQTIRTQIAEHLRGLLIAFGDAQGTADKDWS